LGPTEDADGVAADVDREGDRQAHLVAAADRVVAVGVGERGAAAGEGHDAEREQRCGLRALRPSAHRKLLDAFRGGFRTAATARPGPAAGAPHSGAPRPSRSSRWRRFGWITRTERDGVTSEGERAPPAASSSGARRQLRDQSGENEGSSAAVRTTGGSAPAAGAGSTISRGSSSDRTASPRGGPSGPKPPPPDRGASA